MIHVGDHVRFTPSGFDAWSYGDTVSNDFSAVLSQEQHYKDTPERRGDGCLTDEEFEAFLEWSEEPVTGTIEEIDRNNNFCTVQLDSSLGNLTRYIVAFYPDEEDEFEILTGGQA